MPSVTLSNVSSRCINSKPFTLNGSASGSTYSGNGVNGNSFTPIASCASTHTINYSYTDNNGCSNTATAIATVNGLPQVSISGLIGSYSKNGPPVTLTGVPSGGIFNCDGMSGNTFHPAYGSTSADIVYIYIDCKGCTNSVCGSNIITAMMKQPDVFNGNNERLYPNPNSGNFTLELNMGQQQEADIVIINANGELISRMHKTLAPDIIMLSLTMKDDASGVYFVQVQNENAKRVGRIVKE